MLPWPEIPFNSLESFVFCFVGALLSVGLGRRILQSEFGRKECVFCGASVPSDEYSHHLEICGLKLLSKRQ